jgi:hypothetical protein
MAKTKKPEKFFVWLEQYKTLGATAKKKDMTLSDIFQEAVDTFEDPEDMPKKARVLNVTENTSLKVQTIADKWFKFSEKSPTGNKSDAIYYIIEQYLKRSNDD